MAAPKRSPIILRGIELFCHFIDNTTQVLHHNVGTEIMGMALRDVKHSGEEDTITGIRMFTEQFVPPEREEMRNRVKDMFCDAAVMDNGAVIAFSRSVKIGQLSESCRIPSL